MIKLEEKTYKILSYCDIPEEIREENCQINDASCDVYVEYTITGLEEQKKFDDNFDLDNWILSKWPDLENKTILIHIDY